MEVKLEFSHVPYQYPMCLKRECPKAGTCLRQLAEQCVPADVQFWTIVSPSYLASQQGDCPLYRPATRIRLAKGFVKILEGLPHKQMLNVISRLKGSFTLRTYYRIRKGERLLSPSEQQKIMSILKSCGVTHFQDFDEYIEDYDW